MGSLGFLRVPCCPLNSLRVLNGEEELLRVSKGSLGFPMVPGFLKVPQDS